jgi:RNA polymerase sigma-70 factor (ECF subfamily)
MLGLGPRQNPPTSPPARMSHVRTPLEPLTAPDSEGLGVADSHPEPASSGVSAAPIAFDKLVSEHLDFVWRSLRRFGVPQGEVDDATQQVFLVANDKLAIIRPGSERSFLIAVATRVASHARRSNVRREAARQRFSESPTAEEAPSPEHLMQRLEARDLLDRVLDKMPADLRSVFVLFELEELSIDEVASLLSLPRGTVATRLRRARVVFREEATALNQRERGREP